MSDCDGAVAMDDGAVAVAMGLLGIMQFSGDHLPPGRLGDCSFAGRAECMASGNDWLGFFDSFNLDLLICL